MRLVYSVSFKKSEKHLIVHAISHESFSDYIKTLINEDIERKRCIFNDNERAEIERIINEKLNQPKD